MSEVLKNKEIQNIIYTVMSNNWDTDYSIRYVVVEVSKLVQRDVAFFRMNDDDKIEALKNRSYDSTYPLVICKSLHELIRDVLEILGIKSKVVVATNTKVPLYALIVEGEHGRYFIDALYDLFRSQHRIQPVTYGGIIHSNNASLDDHKLINLPLDYIREMDLELGVIDKEYFSDYINKIKLDFTDRNRSKKAFNTESTLELIPIKMTYISDNFLNVYPVKGTMERIGLYVYYRGQLFNKGEREHFYVGTKDDNNSIIIKIHYGGHDFLYEEKKEEDIYKLVKKH